MEESTTTVLTGTERSNIAVSTELSHLQQWDILYHVLKLPEHWEDKMYNWHLQKE